MTGLKLVTFTPLSGGRYKCNVTGRILPHGATRRHRRILTNKLLRERGMQSIPQPLPKRQPLKRIMGGYTIVPFEGTWFRCPHCETYREVRGRFTGEVQCKDCEEKFIVNLPESKKLVQVEMQINGENGHYYCPHCGADDWLSSTFRGVTDCYDCGERFEIVRQNANHIRLNGHLVEAHQKGSGNWLVICLDCEKENIFPRIFDQMSCKFCG